MKITQKNKDKLLEWGIILVPLLALILYKYFKKVYSINKNGERHEKRR